MTTQKEGLIHSNLTFLFLVLSSTITKSINKISLELSSHIEKEKSFYKSGSIPFFFSIGLESFLFAINLDVVSSSNVFNNFISIIRCECIIVLN